jgi:uncharacterized caspase-like protein/Tfp pilus assembly protein PilF
MKFLRHFAQVFGDSLFCALVSFVWLQTLLFNTAPAHAASRSPRNGDFGPSLEQCGKSKVQAEKIEYCSFVISRSSDRRILERAFNRRGLAYMDLQKFAEAAKDFTEVIKINPRIAGYFDNRQNAYKAMGRLSDALNDANKAIELAPTYTFVFRDRANVYADMGRYDLALRDYDHAITLEPKDAGLFVDRGKVYVKAQQIDKAIADFTQAFDSDRNMTVALRERGFAYRLLGNFDAARADLTLFLRLQPNDEEVVSALRDMAPQPVRLAVTKSDESSPLHVPSGSVLGQSEAQRVSERRVALVVGNSAYRNVPSLTNPANDAVLIAKTLSSLGFELVGGSAQIDLDKPAFEAVVKRFGLLLQGAEVGLFYYAGHGVQVHGENYLVPVSANPERETDVDFEMLGTTLVMRQMEGAHTRLNLILLDACRNNPFGTRASRATSRGLAQMEAPEGTLISFATQPGNVASDGEDGDSPYTKALAQTIPRPGLGLFDVFNQVGLEVKKQTGGSQQPWVSSSPIGGSFFFSRPPEAQPAALAAAPAHAEQPNEAQQVWGTIQNTTSVAVLERFIQQFPASFYSDIARTRLDELKKTQTPAQTAPPPPPVSESALEQQPEPVSQNDRPKVTRYPNMDAPGNDKQWVRNIGSVEECESLCLSDPACAGYTYNIKHTICIPKTVIGPLTQPSDPAITGVVQRQSREAMLVNLSSNYCLDTDGMEVNGGAVRMWTCVKHPNQGLTVNKVGSNLFQLRNSSSNFCLDSDGSSTNGALVRMWGCVRHTNQLWKIQELQTGSLRLKNKASGLCLDTDGVAVNVGGVRMWECVIHPQQSWKRSGWID